MGAEEGGGEGEERGVRCYGEESRERCVSSKELRSYEAAMGADGAVADAAFWGPYVEEWKVPPIERAERFAQKQPFYAKLAGPIFRLVILKGASCFSGRSQFGTDVWSLLRSPPHPTQLCSLPQHARLGRPPQPQPRPNDPSACPRSSFRSKFLPLLTPSLSPVLLREEDDVRVSPAPPFPAESANPSPTARSSNPSSSSNASPPTGLSPSSAPSPNASHSSASSSPSPTPSARQCGPTTSRSVSTRLQRARLRGPRSMLARRRWWRMSCRRSLWEGFRGSRVP